MIFSKDDKLNQKQQIDKSVINSWACFLADIWQDDTKTIKNKLVCNVQDRFIWNSETEEYINEVVDKLNKYKN